MSKQLRSLLIKLWNDIQQCRRCGDAAALKPKPFLSNNLQVMIVSQNPSFRESDYVWGGLDRLPNFNQLKPILMRKAYVTNVIKCPTRRVSSRKARICGYWLEKEVEIIKPKKIIALGYMASLWFSYHNFEFISFPHPSWTLRFNRQDIWEYILNLKETILS